MIKIVLTEALQKSRRGGLGNSATHTTGAGAIERDALLVEEPCSRQPGRSDSSRSSALVSVLASASAVRQLSSAPAVSGAV